MLLEVFMLVEGGDWGISILPVFAFSVVFVGDFTAWGKPSAIPGGFPPFQKCHLAHMPIYFQSVLSYK